MLFDIFFFLFLLPIILLEVLKNLGVVLFNGAHRICVDRKHLRKSSSYSGSFKYLSSFRWTGSSVDSITKWRVTRIIIVLIPVRVHPWRRLCFFILLGLIKWVFPQVILYGLFGERWTVLPFMDREANGQLCPLLNILSYFCLFIE